MTGDHSDPNGSVAGVITAMPAIIHGVFAHSTRSSVCTFNPVFANRTCRESLHRDIVTCYNGLPTLSTGLCINKTLQVGKTEVPHVGMGAGS